MLESFGLAPAEPAPPPVGSTGERVLTALRDGPASADELARKAGLGAGVKLGTLQLDAILNDAFPQTLGGWFSNLPGGFISFPKVSATYAF